MVEQPIRNLAVVHRHTPPLIYNDAIESVTVGLTLLANMHLSLH